MTTAYLTHDDVNAFAARNLAARQRLTLIVLDIRQTAPLADRLVCDLDHLPPSVKADLLSNAALGIDLSDVGVHSYHLTGPEVKALRAAGAAVARTLTATLFVAAAPAVLCG